MALSDHKTERFYQDIFTLTSRPEWNTFVEYLEEVLQVKKENALDLDTLEDLHNQKGQAEILRMVISFRNVAEFQYQFLEGEESSS